MQYTLDPNKKYERKSTFQALSVDEKIEKIGLDIEEMDSRLTAIELQIERREKHIDALLAERSKANEEMAVQLARLRKRVAELDQAELGF